jgi:signal transduction histidine kinase
VKDTGEGISKKVLSKLFTKFATSDPTTGTGLGLYICKNIVEAHGGRIWGVNNLDRKGALFKFTLPIKLNESKH